MEKSHHTVRKIQTELLSSRLAELYSVHRSTDYLDLPKCPHIVTFINTTLDNWGFYLISTKLSHTNSIPCFTGNMFNVSLVQNHIWAVEGDQSTSNLWLVKIFWQTWAVASSVRKLTTLHALYSDIKITANGLVCDGERFIPIQSTTNRKAMLESDMTMLESDMSGGGLIW